MKIPYSPLGQNETALFDRRVILSGYFVVSQLKRIHRTTVQRRFTERVELEPKVCFYTMAFILFCQIKGAGPGTLPSFPI